MSDSAIQPHATVQSIVELLRLKPLGVEGGLFAQTWSANNSGGSGDSGSNSSGGSSSGSAYEGGVHSELLAAYPEAVNLITHLTRPGHELGMPPESQISCPEAGLGDC